MLSVDVSAGGVAALTAGLLRLAGMRWGRPALRFAAGAAGLLAGWSVLRGRGHGVLAVYALVALASAAGAVRDGASKPARRGAAAPALTEAHLWLVALAGFGGWWLSLGGRAAWPHLLGGAVLIAAVGLLAANAWAVVAAASCLAAALIAMGAPAPAAGIALVAAGACAGAGPVAIIAAGLGGAAVWVMDADPHWPQHRLAGAMSVAAPLACLLLVTWWRGRFMRFGRAADPVRAAVAAGLVCLASFSAAAMAGLR